MKLLVVGLVAGIVLGGTATGYAVTKSRPITIRPGTGMVFAGLDFSCYYSPPAAIYDDPGPILDCGRNSTSHAGSTCIGRRLTVSRYHFDVANVCHGPATHARFNRSP